jgi:hypothetical protein
MKKVTLRTSLGLDKTAIMDSLDLVRCVMIPLDQNYYCTTILFI